MTRKQNRTVVVTGGGRGIGAAVTRAFCRAGDRVVIGSRSDAGLAAELGEAARFLSCDVTRAGDLEKLIDAAVEWTGSLDVIVNNAGMSEWKPLEEVDEKFWQKMIDVNLKGVFFGCKAAAARLGSGGCIINVSSLAGKRGSANNAVYCAAKFGVNGLTQSLAKELGPRKIRVNAVCPVYVETDGLSQALASKDAPPAGKNVKHYLSEFAKAQSALGRLPTGDEIAEACLFLASPAASAITGQCLNIDCGVMPQ